MNRTWEDCAIEGLRISKKALQENKRLYFEGIALEADLLDRNLASLQYSKKQLGFMIHGQNRQINVIKKEIQILVDIMIQGFFDGIEGVDVQVREIRE